MTAAAVTGLLPDEDLAGTERVAVDAFVGRLHCPAGSGFGEFADHFSTVDRDFRIDPSSCLGGGPIVARSSCWWREWLLGVSGDDFCQPPGHPGVGAGPRPPRAALDHPGEGGGQGVGSPGLKPNSPTSGPPACAFRALQAAERPRRHPEGTMILWPTRRPSAPAICRYFCP
jgi:hypothetical protein